MQLNIITSTDEKFFDKETVNIGSNDNCDVKIKAGFDFLLVARFNSVEKTCRILNPFKNENLLFRGEPLKDELEVKGTAKIMIKNSEEFITFKLVEKQVSAKPSTKEFTKEDMVNLFGNNVNPDIKRKIEEQKDEIDEKRTAVLKTVAANIRGLKKKLSSNKKTSLFLHIALFCASLACAFGVANYLTGLPLEEADLIIKMPVNIRAVFVYALITFGAGLIFKQGISLFVQNREKNKKASGDIAEKLMTVLPALFFVAVYGINMLYYMAPEGMIFFAVLVSAFFTGTTVLCAAGCGYFHAEGITCSDELAKFEFREDFEKVIKLYQRWIEYFINNMSSTRIEGIKDKIFSLKIKSVGETILGILTAPFLAYGVSNTLAMCFPEAAGWIRISGLRFSPVFLVLASFLIIFAFFSFVNAFTCIKRIQGSEVLKADGFSSYEIHGVNIFGLEGIRRLESEKKRSFIIALSIVVIEFTMNVSYFSGEIGDDVSGLFLSVVAALVPTALLIAETYMLSKTKFDITVREELLAKIE